MRLTKLSLLTLLNGLILYSCSHPCSDTDCVTGNYYGEFRIVSANNGTDLVFGTDKVYDKNTIRFYSVRGTDTTFFESQPVKDFYSNTYDSILQVYFYTQPDTAYLRLSNGDIDTLGISYKTHNTECCGTIADISNFTINNLPDSGGIQEIRK